MSPPLISVITVTFQARKTLENTIKSVASQEPYYEYIVIDGGSTDGTLDIIKKYENAINYWISEPDNGIYEAMNKGISKANGKWLYFLGADDTLEPGILSTIINSFSDEYAIIFGSISFQNGIIVDSYLNKRTLLQNTVHHQSAFYNRNLFENFRYDHQLSIISDYELNLKVYMSASQTRKVPFVIARCSSTGASSNLLISLKETNIIRSKQIHNPLLNIVLSGILHLYYFQKTIRKIIIKKLSKNSTTI